MKVRHLLSMSTGHDDGDMTDMRTREDDDWVKGFLAREVQHEPGTHFVYNNGATYMLSAIISKVTGKSTLEYLRPRLFLPLGIDRAIWDCCPKGITIGASALNITTESIARFGQFYLNRGMWNGHRLLADSWFDLATSYQVSNATNDQPDWQQGYGFQFWRCQNNCYRGDGAFGQYCIVIPEFKMVVAITGSVGSMQDVLDLFWKHIHANVKSAALPDNPEANCALNSKLHSLSLHGPDGKAISPVIPRVSGKMFKRTGGESDFQSVIFDFDPQGCTFTVRSDRGDRSIRAGTTQWAHGVTSIEAAGGKRIAAMGSWTSEDTYEIKLRYTESPSGLTIVTRFDGDSVSVVMTKSARFDSLEGPTFEGQLARVPAGMAMSR